MTREKRIEQLVASMRDRLHDTGGVEELDPPRRYVLVERAAPAYGGGYWLTSHDSPEQAAAYHCGQEAIEDWTAHGLYDLDTGEWSTPQLSVTWHDAGGDCPECGNRRHAAYACAGPDGRPCRQTSLYV